jgi:hypothetical protein
MNYRLLAKSIGIGILALIIILITTSVYALILNFYTEVGIAIFILAVIGAISYPASCYYKKHSKE